MTNFFRFPYHYTSVMASTGNRECLQEVNRTVVIIEVWSQMKPDCRMSSHYDHIVPYSWSTVPLLSLALELKFKPIWDCVWYFMYVDFRDIANSMSRQQLYSWFTNFAESFSANSSKTTQHTVIVILSPLTRAQECSACKSAV